MSGNGSDSPKVRKSASKKSQSSASSSKKSKQPFDPSKLTIADLYKNDKPKKSKWNKKPRGSKDLTVSGYKNMDFSKAAYSTFNGSSINDFNGNYSKRLQDRYGTYENAMEAVRTGKYHNPNRDDDFYREASYYFQHQNGKGMYDGKGPYRNEYTRKK